MRAAWKLGEKEGLAKFRQIAGWLEHDYPDAAAALLEGPEERFTINRPDIPRSLHRCLATSNIVDNPHSGVRDRTRRVCRWRAGMPGRWSAAAFLGIEKSFRRIMGYRDLWALKAILDGSQPATRQGWHKMTMNRRVTFNCAQDTVWTPSRGLFEDTTTSALGFEALHSQLRFHAIVKSVGLECERHRRQRRRALLRLENFRPRW
jgi:hypothetical protein